jgi:hypothetical protein
VRIGAIAGDDRGAPDHGVGHLGVEIEGDRDRHVGRDLADAVQKLAFAVVVMLGHHGAVQGEQHGITAGPDLVDDRCGHLLVGRLGHQARGMRRGRHRNGEFGAGLARDVNETAERGVGALGLLDGRRTAERAGAGEGVDWCWQRRERIGLVHHHGNDKFSRHLALPIIQAFEQPTQPRRSSVPMALRSAQTSLAVSCALPKSHTRSTT